MISLQMDGMTKNMMDNEYIESLEKEYKLYMKYVEHYADSRNMPLLNKYQRRANEVKRELDKLK